MTLMSWIAWVLAMNVAAGVALGAALVADMLLARRVSARWRSALYVAVLLRLALPAQWSSALGMLGGRERAVAASAMSVTDAATAPTALEPPPVATRTAKPGAAVPAGLLLHASIALALASAWAFALGRSRRIVRGAVPARERVRRLGVEGVLEHASAGPAVFGLARPRIVLPSALVDALDDEALAAVLRHEAAHVTRRDAWRLAFVQLAVFAAWPVAAAWIAAWRLRGLIEQACDERAVGDAAMTRRSSYAAALVQVAAWQPLRVRLSLGMLAFGGGLASRLRALRRTKRWPAFAQVAAILGTATLAVLMAGLRSTTVRARDASPQATEIPPVACFHAVLFRGDASSARALGTAVVLGAPADSSARAFTAVVGPGDAIRHALDASAEMLGEHDHPTFVGAWLAVRYALGSEAIVIRARPDIEEGRLAFRLGAMRGGVMREGLAWLAKDEGVLVTLDGEPALHVLLTPIDVAWPEASFRQEPRAWDVDGSVTSAVQAFQDATGLPVPAEAGDRTVVVHVAASTPQEFIAEVAAQAHLVPRRDPKSGMVKLVAGSLAASDEELCDALLADLGGTCHSDASQRLHVQAPLEDMHDAARVRFLIDGIPRRIRAWRPGTSGSEVDVTAGLVAMSFDLAPPTKQGDGFVARWTPQRLSRERIARVADTGSAWDDRSADVMLRSRDEWRLVDALRAVAMAETNSETVSLAVEAWRVTNPAVVDRLLPRSDGGHWGDPASTWGIACRAMQESRVAELRSQLASFEGRASGARIGLWRLDASIDGATAVPADASLGFAATVTVTRDAEDLAVELKADGREGSGATCKVGVPTAYVVQPGRDELVIVIVEPAP